MVRSLFKRPLILVGSCVLLLVLLLPLGVFAQSGSFAQSALLAQSASAQTSQPAGGAKCKHLHPEFFAVLGHQFGGFLIGSHLAKVNFYFVICSDTPPSKWTAEISINDYGGEVFPLVFHFPKESAQIYTVDPTIPNSDAAFYEAEFQHTQGPSINIDSKLISIRQDEHLPETWTLGFEAQTTGVEITCFTPPNPAFVLAPANRDASALTKNSPVLKDVLAC
jgi:hypothetical protein